MISVASLFTKSVQAQTDLELRRAANTLLRKREQFAVVFTVPDGGIISTNDAGYKALIESGLV